MFQTQTVERTMKTKGRLDDKDAEALRKVKGKLHKTQRGTSHKRDELTEAE